MLIVAPDISFSNPSTLAQSRHRAPDLPQARLILPGRRAMTPAMNTLLTMGRDPHV
jgi:hypothetical protein